MTITTAMSTRDIRLRAANVLRLDSICKVFHWRARAEQISIAVDVVDAANCGPEFVVARPRRGKSCLLARVGAVPFVGRDLSRGVRRVLEQIALPILFSVRDCLHLGVNGNHRIAKTIKLVFRFAFGRLDHHRPTDRPRNSRRVKAVIH